MKEFQKLIPASNGKKLKKQDNPSKRYKFKGAIKVAIKHKGVDTTLIPVDKDGNECWYCSRCGYKDISKEYWSHPGLERTTDVIRISCIRCGFSLWDKEKVKKIIWEVLDNGKQSI